MGLNLLPWHQAWTLPDPVGKEWSLQHGYGGWGLCKASPLVPW